MLGKFGNVMEIIQKVQQNADSLQEGLRSEELESSSGDVVRVVMNGVQEIIAIELNPSYLSPDNKAMLEDLLTVCLNDVCARSRARGQSAMSQLASEFNLPPIPGLF